MKRLKQLPEFVRFVMVGIFATALHYGLYFVLQRVINVNIAYTLGYALSFIANFYLTAYFTFGRKPSWMCYSSTHYQSKNYHYDSTEYKLITAEHNRIILFRIIFHKAG